MKKIISLAVLALMTISANAQKKENTCDTLTVTTTPQMHCAGCEKKIKENIRFVKGTKKIETSVSNQEVKIVYDKRKAKTDDYVKAFAKIGYKIEAKK